MIDDKKVRIAIWKARLPLVKGGLICVLLVVTFGLAILHKIPTHPTREIVVRVEAIGVTHGVTGGGRYLVCIIDNDQQIKVFLDDTAPSIQKGQTVKLKEYSQLLFGGKTYQLAKLNNFNG